MPTAAMPVGVIAILFQLAYWCSTIWAFRTLWQMNRKLDEMKMALLELSSRHRAQIQPESQSDPGPHPVR
jgi:hypothetical protein